MTYLKVNPKIIICKSCGKSKFSNDFSKGFLYSYVYYYFIDPELLKIFNIHYKNKDPVKTACCLECKNLNSNVKCKYFMKGDMLCKIDDKVSNYNKVFK